jgi:hypothetical protein
MEELISNGGKLGVNLEADDDDDVDYDDFVT